MGPLSDIFGGNDDNSSTDTNSNMSDGTADISNALGLDISSSNSSYQQDEDGNMSADSSDNSLSLNNDTDSLLSSITDNFSSSSDESSN